MSTNLRLLFAPADVDEGLRLFGRRFVEVVESAFDERFEVGGSHQDEGRVGRQQQQQLLVRRRGQTQAAGRNAADFLEIVVVSGGEDIVDDGGFEEQEFAACE